MPENLSMLILTISAVIGGFVGYMIGTIITDRNRTDSLKIIWDKLDKIIEKVQTMEKKSSEQSNSVSRVYSNQKVSLKTLIDKIIDTADRLEGLNSQKVNEGKANTANPKKIETNNKYPAAEKFALTKTSSKKAEIVSPSEIIPVIIRSNPNEINYRPENFTSRITTLYNQGIIERTRRDIFWETFSVVRIGNFNAVAQRLGEVSAPDFREAGNGDFLAVKKDDDYFVVPMFDLTITSSAFNEGGIGYAFDCPNYDLQSAASIIKVEKSAVFRRDGERFLLAENEKGILILQS